MNKPLKPDSEDTNIKNQSLNYPSWILTDRQICDLELLMNGGFNPLNGFMNSEDYFSVIKNMRLSNGMLWPIPIVLDVDEKFSNSLSAGDKVTLKDKEGFPLAVLNISDKWKPDYEKEAKEVYGTTDQSHPGVSYLININGSYCLGGSIDKISLPHHYDFQNNRHTPLLLKKILKKNKWDKVVAFQTRNPMHRAHVKMTLDAMKELNANLLIHPAVGQTKLGDIDYFTRVRCYRLIMEQYPLNSSMLSLLPLSMRMCGPREAIWHALIRKNYGCTHLIIGRDHAGPGINSLGKPFYGPYDAQNLVKDYQKEIGIEMVPFKTLVYVPKIKKYKPLEEINKKVKYKNISGTELRLLIRKGEEIPSWFTFDKVAEELKKSTPPLIKRGFTIFFTGLSGSGKSTLANGLMIKFLEEGSKPVTLLDGDIVRTNLSSELGFSKKDRSINVRRIGFVASEITKNGGVAICAPIAPYESDRLSNRKLISQHGVFIEVYVKTPLHVCEKRDPKGLYKLARRGDLKKFTGISDPYEEPKKAEIVIDSSIISPSKLVEKIFGKIRKLGLVN
tara:strand:+ start:10584 stop:12263 length:1680 start_codon:yes stop_codon:yes gene_type:complete